MDGVWRYCLLLSLSLSMHTHTHTHTLKQPGTVDLHDSRKLTFSLFPWLVVLVLCVAFGFVGTSFRTLVVPARAVITIMLTLSFVFGLLVLTYQYGMFSWLGMSQLDNMHSIFWLSPVIAYAVCVGLGLDYDVFLLERIHDFRSQGMSHEDSIVEGLASTGTIISSAGLVMLASFGGLLFSVNPGLSQIGFMLCFAVATDTFVVEPLLVPAFMGLIGKYNWWPSKVLNENDNDATYKNVADNDEDEEEGKSYSA
jgi:uncharacterized membrane protein YdfJ with MMPL/SSD domain